MGEIVGSGLFCGWVATGAALVTWTCSPSIDTNYAEASRRLDVALRYFLWWFSAGVLGTAGFFALLVLLER